MSIPSIIYTMRGRVHPGQVCIYVIINTQNTVPEYINITPECIFKQNIYISSFFLHRLISLASIKFHSTIKDNQRKALNNLLMI